MAEFLGFGEGGHYVRDHGLPEICWFAMSELSVADFSVMDTLAGGIGEITGTGYERQSQPTPNWSAPWLGTEVVADFAPITFATHMARDWPEAVRSIVLVTTPDDSGVAVAAWNLRGGDRSGRPRDMSDSFTTETFTPSLRVGHPKK